MGSKGSTEEPERLLAQFGFSSFRPGQRDAVSGALAGRDVLAIMPTGAGKSLCYQLPALAGGGLTVVVSPLIALMADQVTGLRRRGVGAAALSSALSAAQQAAVLGALAHLRLLYVSPERLQGNALQRALRRVGVARLVVDEAHCISQWGHDFRPDYRRLRRVRTVLGEPPVTALTASATPAVRRDIAAALGLEDPVQVTTGFDRPNLAYRVWWAPHAGLKEALAGHVLSAHGFGVRGSGAQNPRRDTQNRGGPGIIYAGTRARTEAFCAFLRAGGLPARAYHAGMTADARAAAQAAFLTGHAPLLVATSAFGMGVDKPDVRFVLHLDPPASLEALYQEAGRAGRDTLGADCTLLVSPEDVERQTALAGAGAPSLLDLKRLYVLLRNHHAVDQPGQPGQPVTAEYAAGALGLGRGQLVGALHLLEDHGTLRTLRQGGALTLSLLEPGGAPPDFAALQGGANALRGAKRALWAAMHRYMSVPECRRAQLLAYFGDPGPREPATICRCDICAPAGRAPLVGESARVLALCSARPRRRRTLRGALAHTSAGEAEALLGWLQREGYLHAPLGWLYTSAAGRRALERADEGRAP